MQRLRLSILLLAAAPAVGCTAQAPEPIATLCEQAAHGRFLGESKSVLYVSDLSVATRFYVDVLEFGTDGHQITFAETDPKRHSIDPW